MLPLGTNRRAFGQWLRTQRKRRGKTLSAVAREIGLSLQRVKRIELGYDRIAPYRLLSFARGYEVSLDLVLDEIRVLEPKLWEEFTAYEKQLLEAISEDTSYARQLTVNLCGIVCPES